MSTRSASGDGTASATTIAIAGAATLLGAIGGAVSLSFATAVFHGAVFREDLFTGQYGLTFIQTDPNGAILGAWSGLVLALLFRGHRAAAAMTAALGGSVLGLVLWCWQGTGIDGLPGFVPDWGLALLWIGAAVAAGCRYLSTAPGGAGGN